MDLKGTREEKWQGLELGARWAREGRREPPVRANLECDHYNWEAVVNHDDEARAVASAE